MSVSKGSVNSLHRIITVTGLIAFLVIANPGCSTPTRSQLVLVDTLSVQDLYPEAQQRARSWKGDAYLVQAQTTFWPVETGGPGRASFSFRARSTDVVGLLVVYDPVKDSFQEEWLSVAKEDERQKIEIADEEWHVDSVEALEIAQAAGGSDFLAEHLDEKLHLRLDLEAQSVDKELRVVWFVVYYAGMPMSADHHVVIDAMTGEVLEVNGEAR